MARLQPRDRALCLYVCLPTLGVAAGLGESLAVCEESNPRHCDSQHAAILTGFILRAKQQTEQ